MTGHRQRAITVAVAVTIFVSSAAVTFMVTDGDLDVVAPPNAGVEGESEPDPYTARDQWIDLRGGAPERETPMAAPNRRLDLRVDLLRRDRLGGRYRVHRDRPEGFTPAAIVIHATGGGEPDSGFDTLGELQRFFARPSARASSHYAIDRDGRVLRMVEEGDAAFHVATPGWNDISVGIELLNDNSGAQEYPPAQLAALTQLVRSLGARYGIPVEGVVRHATVQPEDRRDPVGFPWRSWLSTLA